MCDECKSRFVFVMLAVIIIVILIVYKPKKKAGFENSEYASAEKPIITPSIETYPFNMSMDTPYKTLYSGAEVDPLITAGFYAYRDNLRPVYGARTSDGDVWGLHEYCSSLPEVAGEQTLIDRQGGSMEASSNETGDSRLNLCYDYNGVGDQCDTCHDNGIPVNWNLPSTPFAWYKPTHSDYYSREGIKPYTEGQYAQTEPDHEPQLGSDPDPIQIPHAFDG